MSHNEDSNPQNTNDSNVVLIDENRRIKSGSSEVSNVSLQQPLEFNNGSSIDSDADTQDLLRAIQEGEYPDPDDEGQFPEFQEDFHISGLESHDVEHEIPVTAAEKSAEITGMVEELAGEQSDEEPDQEEELVEILPDLPDLEIKAADQGDSDISVKEPKDVNINTSEQPNSDHLSEKEVRFEDRRDESDHGEVEGDDKSNAKNMNYGEDPVAVSNISHQLPQQMVQTNLVAGFGHAFGSIINGVFSGVGMVLDSGLAAIKQTNDALSEDVSTSVSRTSYHFSPAALAVNDSFNDDVAKDWKQNRVDTEFESLKMDMDSHLRAIERMKQTEWAQKLKSIEESGDPEKMVRAPAILNIAKAKSDFKDADRDMNYFLDHIQQRSERLCSMIGEANMGPERLESLVSKWQESAKKSINELPFSETKESNGFIERIQSAAQNILAGLRAVFAKPSFSASMR